MIARGPSVRKPAERTKRRAPFVQVCLDHLLDARLIKSRVSKVQGRQKLEHRRQLDPITLEQAN